MKWEMVKLEDVCEVIAGQSPPSTTYNDCANGYPFFQGKADFGLLYPKVRIWCSAPKKIALPNDILISVRAPVGPTNLCNIEAAIGRGLSAIRSSTKIDKLFLIYFLRSYSHILEGKATGSTFSAVTQKEIKNIQIPLPPLETQKRIVELLDRARALIDKRKEQIALMDQLIQSLFYDMFGDPVKNPKGWEVKKFGQLLNSIDSGCSPKCLDYPANNSKWGVLKLSAVTGGIYKSSENKQLPDDILPKEKNVIQNGDLLFTRKNTKELVGSCAYVFYTSPKLLIPDLIFRLDTKLDIEKLYIWGLFNSCIFRGKITVLAGGSAASMINISKAKLNGLNIPIPPLSLQNTFAERVQKIEAQKEAMTASLRELEDNFNSMTQRAFKGELV